MDAQQSATKTYNDRKIDQAVSDYIAALMAELESEPSAQPPQNLSAATSDPTRRRRRYQSPLETILECEAQHPEGENNISFDSFSGLDDEYYGSSSCSFASIESISGTLAQTTHALQAALDTTIPVTDQTRFTSICESGNVTIDNHANIQMLYCTSKWAVDEEDDTLQNQQKITYQSDMLTKYSSPTSNNHSDKSSSQPRSSSPPNNVNLTSSVAMLKYACRNYHYEKDLVDQHQKDSPGGDVKIQNVTGDSIARPRSLPPVLGAPDELEKVPQYCSPPFGPLVDAHEFTTVQERTQDIREDGILIQEKPSIVDIINQHVNTNIFDNSEEPNVNHEYNEVKDLISFDVIQTANTNPSYQPSNLTPVQTNEENSTPASELSTSPHSETSKDISLLDIPNPPETSNTQSFLSDGKETEVSRTLDDLVILMNTSAGRVGNVIKSTVPGGGDTTQLKKSENHSVQNNVSGIYPTRLSTRKKLNIPGDYTHVVDSSKSIIDKSANLYANLEKCPIDSLSTEMLSEVINLVSDTISQLRRISDIKLFHPVQSSKVRNSDGNNLDLHCHIDEKKRDQGKGAIESNEEVHSLNVEAVSSNKCSPFDKSRTKSCTGARNDSSNMHDERCYKHHHKSSKCHNRPCSSPNIVDNSINMLKPQYKRDVVVPQECIVNMVTEILTDNPISSIVSQPREPTSADENIRVPSSTYTCSGSASARFSNIHTDRSALSYKSGAPGKSVLPHTSVSFNHPPLTSTNKYRHPRSRESTFQTNSNNISPKIPRTDADQTPKYSSNNGCSPFHTEGYRSIPALAQEAKVLHDRLIELKGSITDSKLHLEKCLSDQRQRKDIHTQNSGNQAKYDKKEKSGSEHASNNRQNDVESVQEKREGLTQPVELSKVDLKHTTHSKMFVSNKVTQTEMCSSTVDVRINNYSAGLDSKLVNIQKKMSLPISSLHDNSLCGDLSNRSVLSAPNKSNRKDLEVSVPKNSVIGDKQNKKQSTNKNQELYKNKSIITDLTSIGSRQFITNINTDTIRASAGNDAIKVLNELQQNPANITSTEPDSKDPNKTPEICHERSIAKGSKTLPLSKATQVVSTGKSEQTRTNIESTSGRYVDAISGKEEKSQRTATLVGKTSANKPQDAPEENCEEELLSLGEDQMSFNIIDGDSIFFQPKDKVSKSIGTGSRSHSVESKTKSASSCKGKSKKKNVKYKNGDIEQKTYRLSRKKTQFTSSDRQVSSCSSSIASSSKKTASCKSSTKRTKALPERRKHRSRNSNEYNTHNPPLNDIQTLTSLGGNRIMSYAEIMSWVEMSLEHIGHEEHKGHSDDLHRGIHYLKNRPQNAGSLKRITEVHHEIGQHDITSPSNRRTRNITAKCKQKEQYLSSSPVSTYGSQSQFRRTSQLSEYTFESNKPSKGVHKSSSSSGRVTKTGRNKSTFNEGTFMQNLAFYATNNAGISSRKVNENNIHKDSGLLGREMSDAILRKFFYKVKEDLDGAEESKDQHSLAQSKNVGGLNTTRRVQRPDNSVPTLKEFENCLTVNMRPNSDISSSLSSHTSISQKATTYATEEIPLKAVKASSVISASTTSITSPNEFTLSSFVTSVFETIDGTVYHCGEEHDSSGRILDSSSNFTPSSNITPPAASSKSNISQCNRTQERPFIADSRNVDTVLDMLSDVFRSDTSIPHRHCVKFPRSDTHSRDKKRTITPPKNSTHHPRSPNTSEPGRHCRSGLSNVQTFKENQSNNTRYIDSRQSHIIGNVSSVNAYRVSHTGSRLSDQDSNFTSVRSRSHENWSHDSSSSGGSCRHVRGNNRSASDTREASEPRSSSRWSVSKASEMASLSSSRTRPRERTPPESFCCGMDQMDDLITTTVTTISSDSLVSEEDWPDPVSGAATGLDGSPRQASSASASSEECDKPKKNVSSDTEDKDILISKESSSTNTCEESERITRHSSECFNNDETVKTSSTHAFRSVELGGVVFLGVGKEIRCSSFISTKTRPATSNIEARKEHTEECIKIRKRKYVEEYKNENSKAESDITMYRPRKQSPVKTKEDPNGPMSISQSSTPGTEKTTLKGKGKALTLEIKKTEDWKSSKTITITRLEISESNTLTLLSRNILNQIRAVNRKGASLNATNKNYSNQQIQKRPALNIKKSFNYQTNEKRLTPLESILSIILKSISSNDISSRAKFKTFPSTSTAMKSEKQKRTTLNNKRILHRDPCRTHSVSISGSKDESELLCSSYSTVLSNNTDFPVMNEVVAASVETKQEVPPSSGSQNVYNAVSDRHTPSDAAIVFSTVPHMYVTTELASGIVNMPITQNNTPQCDKPLFQPVGSEVISISVGSDNPSGGSQMYTDSGEKVITPNRTSDCTLRPSDRIKEEVCEENTSESLAVNLSDPARSTETEYDSIRVNEMVSTTRSTQTKNDEPQPIIVSQNVMICKSVQTICMNDEECKIKSTNVTDSELICKSTQTSDIDYQEITDEICNDTQDDTPYVYRSQITVENFTQGFKEQLNKLLSLRNECKSSEVKEFMKEDSSLNVQNLSRTLFVRLESLLSESCMQGSDIDSESELSLTKLFDNSVASDENEDDLYVQDDISLPEFHIHRYAKENNQNWSSPNANAISSTQLPARELALKLSNKIIPISNNESKVIIDLNSGTNVDKFEIVTNNMITGRDGRNYIEVKSSKSITEVSLAVGPSEQGSSSSSIIKLKISNDTNAVTMSIESCESNSELGSSTRNEKLILIDSSLEKREEYSRESGTAWNCNTHILHIVDELHLLREEEVIRYFEVVDCEDDSHMERNTDRVSEVSLWYEYSLHSLSDIADDFANSSNELYSDENEITIHDLLSPNSLRDILSVLSYANASAELDTVHSGALEGEILNDTPKSDSIQDIIETFSLYSSNNSLTGDIFFPDTMAASYGSDYIEAVVDNRLGEYLETLEGRILIDCIQLTGLVCKTHFATVYSLAYCHSVLTDWDQVCVIDPVESPVPEEPVFVADSSMERGLVGAGDGTAPTLWLELELDPTYSLQVCRDSSSLSVVVTQSVADYDTISSPEEADHALLYSQLLSGYSHSTAEPDFSRPVVAQRYSRKRIIILILCTILCILVFCGLCLPTIIHYDEEIEGNISQEEFIFDL